MRNRDYILEWTQNLQAIGRYSYTYDEVRGQFPDISGSAINQSLSGLVARGRVLSVFKGFYVIISPEYSLRGIIPPELFIDSLMKYAKKDYYIGLLSAAALQGSSHQRSQEYFVLHELPAIRPTVKRGIKINYIGRQNVNAHFLEIHNTEAGYVNVSSPELTAIDLLQYVNHIGGVNRAATVINELCEKIRPAKFTKELISETPASVLQRLGYIIENVVGNRRLADDIHSRVKNVVPYFMPRLLKNSGYSKGFVTDTKWKIVINTKIEIDE